MIEMIDIYPDRMTWIDAIRKYTGKGYRRTSNGKYECFVSDECRTVSLGTYNTMVEADWAVFSYKANRLIDSLVEYDLNPDDSVVFMHNYIAFDNGLIFNLYGDLKIGSIDRNGYVHGLFNGKNVQHHRIIASLFCERFPGKDYVNHIDGNKQNNDSYNLEWVTRSENTYHAFRTGLQRTINGTPIFTGFEKRYMRDHCHDYYKDVARELNRNEGTVRKYMGRFRRGDNIYD